MSLLNAWVTPSDVLVCVDTDGAAPGGSRIVTSKLLPIPHLAAAIALRGQAALLAGLLLRSLSFSSYDDLVDEMPALLVEVAGSLPSELIAADGVAGQGHEVLVAGYSPRRERMHGRMFIDRDGRQAERDVEDYFLSPWDKAWRVPPRRDNVQQIAAKQVEWMRSSFANAACGGSLIMCRLMQGGLVVSHGFVEEGVAA